MPAFSDQERTVVSGEATVGTGPVELDATDATDFILGHIPFPGCNSIPGFDFHFHGGVGVGGVFAL